MGDVWRRSHWLSAVALVAMVGGALAGCDPKVRLQEAGDAGPYAVEGVAHIRPHHLVSVGQMVVCVSDPGAATITSVTPVKRIGRIRVKAFAVRRNPGLLNPPGEQLGDERRPLSVVGFGHSHLVDMVCGSRPGAGYELGLELVKPSLAPAAAGGWLIHYRSGDQQGTMTFPFGVVLCSRPSAEAPECRRLTHRLTG